MAESNCSKPSMNWQAVDLEQEFQRFITHCQFMFAGPLSEKTEKVQIGYLMTYIGDKGREAYSTFTWKAAEGETPAENETLEGVISKFRQHCSPRKNQIRATVNFQRRKQETGERFDDFVTALRVLVKDCAYTDPDRMIRDAIVVKSLHNKVCEKCLDEGDALTVEKAVQIGQNYEASQESMRAFAQHSGEDTTVSSVQKPYKKQYTQRKYQNSKFPSSTSRDKQCTSCGYAASHSVCPAKGQTCNFCSRRGHFEKVCRMKLRQGATANKVEEYCEVEDCSESEEDDWHSHLVSSVRQDYCVAHIEGNSKWWSEVTIGGKSFTAQIDTGATKSILPISNFKELGLNKPLMKSDCKLKSYTNHPLPVAGRAVLPTRYKGKTVNVEFQVVDVNQKPLLSGDICTQLGMIERINNITDKYPELGKTTGTLPGTYELKIDASVTPVVHAPRRQPRALITKIIDKLHEMEREEHIVKVNKPTDWVSSMVTVVKNDKVRICIDPSDLNRAIKREHYPIPTVEEVVASLPPDAKLFSVIDAKSGFLQIKLESESSMLTTFNTPIGRFRWLRLPMGIRSAPEVFQRIMDNMLEGIQGARAIMDDILVAGVDEADHDRVMKQVVTKATEYNLKLNFSKCKVKATEVKYVGHTLTASGLQPDEDKLEAVKKMPPPTSKEEVRRFLGFIQYLAKFIPNLSEVDAPLRELLSKEIEFHWDKPQISSFEKLKDLCCTTPVLAYYDPKKLTVIQCDSSSYAVGGVLLQEGRPIAYTSRSLNTAEQKYAQIEKETLAIVHACKKFHYYIFGKSTTVESDHKPLQSIFSKPLLAAPMRLQSMMLRLQPYDLTVIFKPGKEIPLGDTLSRANLPHCEPELEPEMINMLEHVSITPGRYSQIQIATSEELAVLRDTILQGWPDTKSEVPTSIREYWSFRDELSIYDGVLYKGMRFVVPPSMRKHMMSQIHASHQGIVKCKKRASEALFWPGMSSQIEDAVNDCPDCNMYQNRQAQQPLQPTVTPDLPWIEVAADIFEWEGSNYLLTVDYFSKFIEVDYLPSMGSSATISALKGQLCRHGIAEKIRTDNGPQFSSREFQEFCREYDIIHVTSSPHYAQSNGEAERAVQTVKRLWSKCADKNLALLDYRTTPLESCNLSPAQLSMSRRPRNRLPAARSLLQPKQLDIPAVRRALDADKERQKHYYDKRSSQGLPALQKGDPVSMAPFPGSKKWLPATIVNKHSSPRSYVVERGNRRYRRNRKDLRISSQRAVEQAKQTQQWEMFNRPIVRGMHQHDKRSTDAGRSLTSRKQHYDQVPTEGPTTAASVPNEKPTEAEKACDIPDLQADTEERSKDLDPRTPVKMSSRGRAIRPPKFLQDYET